MAHGGSLTTCAAAKILETGFAGSQTVRPQLLGKLCLHHRGRGRVCAHAFARHGVRGSGTVRRPQPALAPGVANARPARTYVASDLLLGGAPGAIHRQPSATRTHGSRPEQQISGFHGNGARRCILMCRTGVFWSNGISPDCHINTYSGLARSTHSAMHISNRLIRTI